MGDCLASVYLPGVCVGVIDEPTFVTCCIIAVTVGSKICGGFLLTAAMLVQFTVWKYSKSFSGLERFLFHQVLR